ncbi:MAG: hypothetical protein AAF721_26420 [Myxococcota bacterium]
MKTTHLLVALSIAPLASACATEEPGDGQQSESELRVSYYDDVLPVLTTRCQSCHADGGVAPFAVDNYEDAKAWGAAMAESARARTMPPFAVDASGECNTFADAQWLDEEEIAVIEAWVEGGMEKGDENAERVELPTPNALRDTGNVVTLSGPANYSPVGEDYPGGELEDYQCFLAEYDADEDRFLTGFDVAPGNVATVHHVLALEVDPEFAGNGAQIEKLDAESPDQVGWDCFGAAGDGVIPEGVPVAWAPGTGAVNYPEGTGIRIEAGHLLVIQMHYNLANGDGTDTTEIEVAMADSVEREGKQALIDPFLFSAVLGNPESIPAGQERAEYTWEMPLEQSLFVDEDDDAKVDVYGMLPHMHQRGQTFDVEFEVDGAMECGAKVAKWDFNWQRIYFYDQPKEMTWADKVKVTCGYNTMADSEPVLPGFGTADEMCLLGLYVVPQ